MGGVTSNTILLIHGDGANSTQAFNDASPSGKWVSFVGSALVVASRFWGGNGAVRLAGPAARLVVSNGSDFQFGSDFTIDFRIFLNGYPTGLSNVGYVAGAIPSRGEQWGFGYQNSNVYGQYYSNNSCLLSWVVTYTLALSTWHHIAIDRQGSNWHFFVSGVSIPMSRCQGGSAQSDFAAPWSHHYSNVSVFTIGERGDSYYQGNAFFDEFRITKGVALYLDNFTPPTTPYTTDTVENYTGGITSDVALWIPGDGTDGSSNFIDRHYGSAIALTKVGAPKIVASQAKFGNGAIALDGATDHFWMSMTSSFASMWAGLNEIFTLDFWARWSAPATTAAARSCVFGTQNDANNYLRFGARGNGVVVEPHFALVNSGSAIVQFLSAGVISAGVWHHFAITKQSAVWRLFQSGALIGVNVQSISAFVPTSPFFFGRNGNSTTPELMNGQIDEIRLTKGVAIDFTGVTPTTGYAYELPTNTITVSPIAASEAVNWPALRPGGIGSGTVLWIQGDGADLASGVINRAPGGTALAPPASTINHAKITTSQKASLGSANAGALWFDGADDYVNIPAHSMTAWAGSTNIVALDFWMRFSSPASTAGVRSVAIAQYQDANNQWYIGARGAGGSVQLHINFAQTAGTVFGGLYASIVSGTWYHVAVMKQSMVWRAWLGSALLISTTASIEMAATSALMAIGRRGDGLEPMNGQVDEVRMVRGVAIDFTDYIPAKPYTYDLPAAPISITTPSPDESVFTFRESIRTPTPVVLSLTASARESIPVLEVPTNAGTIYLFGTAYEFLPIYGQIETDLPVVSASMVGNNVMEGSVPVITGAITGNMDRLVSLTVAMPIISGAISGRTEKLGSITGKVPKITVSITALGENGGSVSGRVPAVRGQLTGSTGKSWVFTATIPAITGKITGIRNISGVITADLPVVEVTIRALSLVFETLSMNCAHKGLTNYTNWPFNSFCTYKGRRFACGADGIHEIEGTDDNGTDIAMTVKTGLIDLETQQVLQRLRHAFIGYQSDGNLVLSVITDDNVQYDYPITSVTTNDGGMKVKLGKGFKDRYYYIQLANSAGSTLNLDKLHIFGEPVMHRKR